MTVSLKHTFQSAKADGTDSSLIQPSNWNAEHELTAAAGTVLGRDTSGAGAAQELPIAVTAAGNVGLGTSTPAEKLSVVGKVESTTGGFKFPDGTTQTTAATGGVAYLQNVQSGNYTLVLDDAGKQIYSANTGSQTITIPTNASVAFPIGSVITIVNFGTNIIDLSLAGVSVYNNGSKTTTSNPCITVGTLLQLVKTGTNDWNSTFGSVVSSIVPTSYLVASSGGAGGSGGSGGGGGGAGGILSGTSNLTRSTLYTITVASGGAATATGLRGSNGSSSSFNSVAPTGGGGGGGNTPQAGANGGSGGGGAGSSGGTPGAGGTGVSGEGFAGGTGALFNLSGGGGGGASAVGHTAPGAVAGNGGAGSASSITGTSVTRGGGGGAGSQGGTPGTGGAGGGGDGTINTGVAGTVNTGGGGGGGMSVTGGNGGSGVVIISSPIVAFATTGSPTVTTSGGNTIYQFNSSGSITF